MPSDESLSSDQGTLREVERIRQQKPRLGADALGDLHELGGQIVDAVDVQMFKRDLDRDIREVHVCGSFAAGTATAVFSDLDVRVVVDEGIEPFKREDIETALRVDAGPDIVPDVCAFLDVLIAPDAPSEDTPSVLIWDGGRRD